MKPESLVIAGQPYRGEYVLKLCTRVAMRSSMLDGESPSAIHRSCEVKSQYTGASPCVKGESSSK